MRERASELFEVDCYLLPRSSVGVTPDRIARATPRGGRRFWPSAPDHILRLSRLLAVNPPFHIEALGLRVKGDIRGGAQYLVGISASELVSGTNVGRNFSMICHFHADDRPQIFVSADRQQPSAYHQQVWPL